MYQPEEGPTVPVAAVHELLTAIGKALSILRPSSSDTAGVVDLWAEVKVRVCALPGSFELNARYPPVRDEANLRCTQAATAAITAFLASHAQASEDAGTGVTR